MITAAKLAISVLTLAAVCLAKEGLTIDNKHKERVSTPEVEKIYSSACSVVQQEFDVRHALHPQVRLVLAADKNEVWFPGREVRLTKWNRYAFAQGVVWLAFLEIMPSQQRLTIAKRAVNWAPIQPWKSKDSQSSGLARHRRSSDCGHRRGGHKRLGQRQWRA